MKNSSKTAGVDIPDIDGFFKKQQDDAKAAKGVEIRAARDIDIRNSLMARANTNLQHPTQLHFEVTALEVKTICQKAVIELMRHGIPIVPDDDRFTNIEMQIERLKLMTKKYQLEQAEKVADELARRQSQAEKDGDCLSL